MKTEFGYWFSTNSTVFDFSSQGSGSGEIILEEPTYSEGAPFNFCPYKEIIYMGFTYVENSISWICSWLVSYGWIEVSLQFLKILAL